MKKYKVGEKPTSKQNCICWLENGEKIPAYFHQKKQSFIGRYGEWQDKKIEDVVEWSYAILSVRHSRQFEEALFQLTLKDGISVFKNEFSAKSGLEQQKLWNEFELIQAAIKYQVEAV